MSQPTIVLVDTNCFLRLYYSPVRPLLGRVFGSRQLMILDSLNKEFERSPELTAAYPWLTNSPEDEERAGAILKLREPTKNRVKKAGELWRSEAESEMVRYCAAQNIDIRLLSRTDVEVLATSDVLDCELATDEWPMRHVYRVLMGSDPLSTIDVLHLMEAAGALNADQRRGAIESMLRSREKLPRGWEQVYDRLFGEAPPTLP